jgi:hypothetical protein
MLIPTSLSHRIHVGIIAPKRPHASEVRRWSTPNTKEPTLPDQNHAACARPAVELRGFRYFRAVVEELHFGRAADRMHTTQPPLSRAIRRFEQEFGVRLLGRSSKTVNHRSHVSEGSGCR